MPPTAPLWKAELGPTKNKGKKLKYLYKKRSLWILLKASPHPDHPKSILPWHCFPFPIQQYNFYSIFFCISQIISIKHVLLPQYKKRREILLREIRSLFPFLQQPSNFCKVLAIIHCPFRPFPLTQQPTVTAPLKWPSWIEFWHYASKTQICSLTHLLKALNVLLGPVQHLNFLARPP